MTPIFLPPDRKSQLEENLLLIFSGLSRTASQIAGHYINQIKLLKTEYFRISEINAEAVRILTDHRSNLDELGALLDEQWMIKKTGQTA